MKKILRQIMTLATLCWVMASCSDDTFNQEYGEGMGYLHLTLGKVDVELSSTTKADAGSLPDDLIPTTADFMIDIKQGSISAEGFPKKYSDLTGGVELKAGGYTVTRLTFPVHLQLRFIPESQLRQPSTLFWRMRCLSPL